MSENIVLKQGLDVPVSGSACLRVGKSMLPPVVAVCPGDFKGLLPRLLVKEGDRVLCGSPVIADKKNPDILLPAPASGTVESVVRGEKRKLLAVLIRTDDRQEYAPLSFGALSDEASVKAALLSSGLWPFIVQRPYGIIADPAVTPSAIYVSAFNTAPLAADTEFTLGTELAAIQKGIDALSKIAPVHVGVDASLGEGSAFLRLTGCTLHGFKGKHPAGNVGVQISHIRPIGKGDTVWTLPLFGVAAIGKSILKGRLELRRKVAVCGPAAIEPSYAETIPGTPVSEFAAWYGNSADELRFVSGDLLSGRNAGIGGFLGWADDQLSLIREGVEPELLGWIRPLRLAQFSTDRSYFSWLMPWRRYDMDTNLHGGKRAFLMNESYYKKVLPIDIFPVSLAKACLAGDIEKMEKFGIYEVLPCDLATCEFVDPSKNDIQEIIAKGIDLMLKEMA